MRKKRILFLLLLLLGVSILWAGRLQRERTGTAENLTEEEKLSSDVQEMPQETADITPVQRMTQMQGAKEPAREVQDTQDGLFYYEALSDAEKEAYCQIYTALISRQKETLSILDSGRAEVLYQYVLNDHPEIFYSSSFSMEGREWCAFQSVRAACLYDDRKTAAGKATADRSDHDSSSDIDARRAGCLRTGQICV